jgi:CheY-like chemotaxis protein
MDTETTTDWCIVMVKLLFVDDERAIRQLFVKLVASQNIIVETAGDGESALIKLEAFSPDVVFTDVVMPRMDGLSLLEEIKRHYPEIFVVVVTGNASVPDAVRAIKAGAYDYLMKPFDCHAILGLIEKITEHRQMLTENIRSNRGHRESHIFESNPGLVTATIDGNTLTLTYAPGVSGSAVLDIRGTSNGKTVETSFRVTVPPRPVTAVQSPPFLASREGAQPPEGQSGGPSSGANGNTGDTVRERVRHSLYDAGQTPAYGISSAE